MAVIVPPLFNFFNLPVYGKSFHFVSNAITLLPQVTVWSISRAGQALPCWLCDRKHYSALYLYLSYMKHGSGKVFLNTSVLDVSILIKGLVYSNAVVTFLFYFQEEVICGFFSIR